MEGGTQGVSIGELVGILTLILFIGVAAWGYVLRQVDHARKRAADAEAAVTRIERDFASLQLSIAKSYASNEYLKDVEKRILDELHYIRRVILGGREKTLADKAAGE